MPKLSAFPKCYMDELCVTKTMTLFDWIELAGTLGVDGVEVYPGFFQSFEPKYLHPEFAQDTERFLEIIGQIDSPWFGVNYDPSNAIIAGQDPLEVLAAIKSRVVSMHASDRYLASGTLEELEQQDGTSGYAQNLKHGVIGRGLNNYDEIFSMLKAEGFDGWISIEDGINGIDELRESVRFLRIKIAEHF